MVQILSESSKHLKRHSSKSQKKFLKMLSKSVFFLFVLQVIPLRSAWGMTAVFAPSGNFVACGGMDNMLTVYDINNRDSSGMAKLYHEFLGYEGFLSSCRFLGDESLVTGTF